LSDSPPKKISGRLKDGDTVVVDDDDGQIQFCRPISKNHCPSFA